MTADQRSAMDAEFDDVARWTADAVGRLGHDHAVPAACRGSASPAALDWLGHACGLTADAVLLDAGGGMGGPAAYAACKWGVRPVVVEPAFGACRTARRLFGMPVLRAAGERLPVRTASVGTVWCLGVLCTVADKAPLMAELRCVLSPGGTLGLMVLVATAPDLQGVPEGNHFPTAAELATLLADSGFEIVAQIDAVDLPGTPERWQAAIERVDADVAAHHGGDPRPEQAQAQEQTMGRLIAAGEVAVRYVHAATRSGVGTPGRG